MGARVRSATAGAPRARADRRASISRALAHNLAELRRARRGPRADRAWSRPTPTATARAPSARALEAAGVRAARGHQRSARPRSSAPPGCARRSCCSAASSGRATQAADRRARASCPCVQHAGAARAARGGGGARGAAGSPCRSRSTPACRGWASPAEAAAALVARIAARAGAAPRRRLHAPRPRRRGRSRADPRAARALRAGARRSSRARGIAPGLVHVANSAALLAGSALAASAARRR